MTAETFVVLLLPFTIRCCRTNVHAVNLPPTKPQLSSINNTKNFGDNHTKEQNMAGSDEPIPKREARAGDSVKHYRGFQFFQQSAR
jgi:hypothetical protein